MRVELLLRNSEVCIVRVSLAFSSAIFCLYVIRGTTWLWSSEVSWNVDCGCDNSEISELHHYRCSGIRLLAVLCLGRRREVHRKKCWMIAP